MFQRILVPIDDNEMSRRALATATTLAEALGARVLALHVIDPPPPYTTRIAQQLPAGELERSQDEHAAEVFASLRPTGAAGERVEFRTLRAERRVWQEIVAAAQHADLVVVGTHGRDGVARAMMGSVAEHVARHDGLGGGARGAPLARAGDARALSVDREVATP